MARLEMFEVGVFNREVRTLVEKGAKHPGFRDSWADLQWLEVRAYSEDDALHRMALRYPADRGFVLTAAVAMNPEET